MNTVADFAEQRALRAQDLDDLDEDLAAGVGEEMAAALARVEVDQEVAATPTELQAVEHAASPALAQWVRFRDQFAEAMEGGLYRVEDLEAEVASGQAYFWPGRAAALVAKREIYPSGEAVMQVLWAAGDLAEVLTLLPGVEATARLLGCASMLVEGRKGWERVLKAHGYASWSVTVGKAL